jgi:ABC-type lipoprotein release transport system permease subunit
LIAIVAATTTLTLGLLVRGVATDPYQTTREATDGPDVVAGGAAAELSGLEGLIDAPGVVGHSGPYPVAQTVLKADGRKADVQAIGRDASPASTDQPEVTQGSWVREGGVVVEAAFADALGLSAGDPITLKGRSFQVVGVAVTAAIPLYPEVSCLAGHCVPGVGVVWSTRADARSLAPRPEALGYVLNLKLADPAAAPAFVDARLNHPPAPGGTAWQEILDTNANLVGNQRRALLTGSWLLALLAVASVAVLVGGRMAAQIRRVGLLKAVGGTPSLITAVLLAEYVLVALLAAAAGLAVGWLAAPLLTEPGAGVLGSAGASPLTMSTVGLVIAVALGVAVAATVVPAIRASRTSTVLALADSARPPRRTAWLIVWSSRLPVPLLLGLRLAARRPRRSLLCAASVAITVSGIVAALGAHADLNAQQLGVGSRGDQLNEVLLVITITLVSLAAVNAIFITWATALDARHSSALARALGATPHEVSAGLSAAQVFPALAGALLGIPGGIGLLAAVDPEGATVAPLWQLLGVVPASVLVIAGLTAIPALTSARRPPAEVLQSELA